MTLFTVSGHVFQVASGPLGESTAFEEINGCVVACGVQIDDAVQPDFFPENTAPLFESIAT